VGRNDEDHQVFSGFGMENVTEAVLAQHLAEEFCAAPTPAETQKILNMRQQFWPLILPTLGDLDSLADLPLLSAAGLAALQGAWEFVEGKPPELPERLNSRESELAALRHVISGQVLTLPITAADLQQRFNVLREGNTPNPQPIVVPALGTWRAPIRGNVTLTLAQQKKTSLNSLTELYGKQFNVRFVGELMQVVRGANPVGTFPPSTNSLKTFPANQILQFPNTDSVSKLTITTGGFQSWGEKVLSSAKVIELADS